MKKKLKKIIVKLNIVDLLSIPLFIFRIFPIKKNRILFENFTGKGYGDSPKYIAEHLLKSNDKYELFWVFRKGTKIKLPKGIFPIKLYSIKFFYIMATSKIWISNSRLDQYVVKRKDQFYIQTWHGGLGIKKIEYDVEDKMSEYYKKVMAKDNSNIDIMISNGKFCTELYKRGFKYKGKIVEVGTPRNDVLINDKTSLNNKVRKIFNINSDDKIILYAPTFRNNYEKNPYDINFKGIKEIYENKFKCKCHIIVKMHPRITNSENLINNSNVKMINATSYPDIQELICACDILITDYSSTMMEAMIANKPVIIYANDIDSYIDERGFYFKFEELPFPLAKNNDDLKSVFESLDLNKILSSYKNFKEKVGLKELGTSTNKVCKIIENEISNKKMRI